MTVLIITRSDDNASIDSVTAALHARGAKVVRLDTDLFPTRVKLEATLDDRGSRRILTTDTGRFDLSEVAAVWYRRFNAASAIPKALDKQLREASIIESRATLLGLIADLDAFHLDSIDRVRRASHKQLQLRIARECGLLTPKTLTTNDPDAVRAFGQSCPQGVIAKMLSSFAIYEKGEEQVVFTNKLSPEDLSNPTGLDLCPMTFQELIPKKLELRTTVVGRKSFTASIDSQSSDRAKLDWRREGAALSTKWQPYDLPSDVDAALMRLMDYFGLNYGAVDFLLTPEGKHIFLEVNPVGEFFWLEKSPRLPIGPSLAACLTGNAPRRESPVAF